MGGGRAEGGIGMGRDTGREATSEPVDVGRGAFAWRGWGLGGRITPATKRTSGTSTTGRRSKKKKINRQRHCRKVTGAARRTRGATFAAGRPNHLRGSMMTRAGGVSGQQQHSTGTQVCRDGDNNDGSSSLVLGNGTRVGVVADPAVAADCADDDRYALFRVGRRRANSQCWRWHVAAALRDVRGAAGGHVSCRRTPRWLRLAAGFDREIAGDCSGGESPPSGPSAERTAAAARCGRWRRKRPGVAAEVPRHLHCERLRRRPGADAPPAPRVSLPRSPGPPPALPERGWAGWRRRRGGGCSRRRLVHIEGDGAVRPSPRPDPSLLPDSVPATLAWPAGGASGGG